MKIWQKISLVCISILVVVLCFCSVFILLNSQNEILDLTIEQAISENENLSTSTSQIVEYFLDKDVSETVKKSAVKYCFSQFASETSVLVYEKDVIYSNISINPSEYLTTKDVFNNKINGRNILIIKKDIDISGDVFSFYTVKDISNVYNSIYQMALYVVFISFIGMIIGTIGIIILIKKTTKPIDDLSKTSKIISEGNYSVRAEVKSRDELSELAKVFNTMANSVENHVAKLTDTNERQKLFISGVSHEFKTPLTVMLMHSKLLREANLTDIEKDKSLAYIQNQCVWLDKMVQTMLKLLSLDKEIEKDDFEIKKLFEKVNQHTHSNLTISVHDEKIYANFELMELLLINLIDNANKSYAEQNEKNIYLSAYDNVIEVRDEGCGIDEKVLDKIFEPFFMVDKSRSKKNGGTGLGLALVKKIAEVHNAKIEVTSKIGFGTSFKFITF